MNDGLKNWKVQERIIGRYFGYPQYILHMLCHKASPIGRSVVYTYASMYLCTYIHMIISTIKV